MATDFPVSLFQSALLAWFQSHKRDLPWRREPRDPYHVWLAEIMLQQTQVATVIPYYERWLQHFPTLESLGEASVDDVLKQWEGLGYYSRARNFHKAVHRVIHEYGGQIPNTVDELMKLPGIGRYTAGAVASLAFEVDAPILDGNLIRVLSRVIALAEDHRSPSGLTTLWGFSNQLIPSGRSGEFNEAMMDLGAMICTPKAPDCLHCPLQTLCIAYAKGAPESYPVRSQKTKAPHKDIANAFIRDATGRILMAQRPLKGLLGGLWELPGGEVQLDVKRGAISRYATAAIQLTQIIRARTGLQLHITPDDFSIQVKHAFTHFRITRHVAILTLAESVPATTSDSSYMNLKWVRLEDMDDLALTRSDHKILDLVAATQKDGDHLL